MVTNELNQEARRSGQEHSLGVNPGGDRAVMGQVKTYSPYTLFLFRGLDVESAGSADPSQSRSRLMVRSCWRLHINLDQSQRSAVGWPAEMSSYAGQAKAPGLRLWPDTDLNTQNITGVSHKKALCKHPEEERLIISN